MKKISIISLIILQAASMSAAANPELLSQMSACVQEKFSFVQKHDTLNMLPRIATICAQLQEICRESQTICQERRFALDRELAILVQLYFKQLPKEEVIKLKDILKKHHELQRQLFADPATHKEYSQRQKHYIELILM